MWIVALWACFGSPVTEPEAPPPPTPGSVTGRVVDTTGRGLPDVDVIAGESATRTNSLGLFQLEVPPDQDLVLDVTGPVQLRVALVDKPEELAAAPGGMAWEGGQLESFGMVEVHATQQGEPIELKSAAQLEFPVLPGTDKAALWHFDEDKGLWVQEGQLTITDGVARMSVAHFSWWNCDEPLEAPSSRGGRCASD